MDRGPLTNDDAGALEAWLEGDSRRLGALMRARALFLRTESAWALEPVFKPAGFKPGRPAPSRRRILGWGAGGAIAASAACVTAGFMLTASKSYATDRGEVRQVPLAGGSTLTLNTSSRATVGSRSDGRDIRLLTGEAFLNLNGESSRPFVLRTGDWRVLAGTASFVVRMLPEQPAILTVHRGQVEVGRNGDGPSPVTLGEGHRLVLATGGGARAVAEALNPDELSRELAWREGKLAFRDDRLDAAVRDFARYSDTPIVIRDPALAAQTVTGLFASNDPVGFAQAVGAAFGAKVRVEKDRVILG